MTRSAILVSGVVVALAATTAAQQLPARPAELPRQQTPAPSPPAQFAAGVDVVEVEVSVSDKRGRPVTDLTARDFEIREDGQSQTIQAIYLASLDRAVLSAPVPAAPPTGTSADVPERRQLKQRVFVFFLDMTHLSTSGFTRSRDAIAGFLKDGMTPQDLVGIVAGDKMLGNRIGPDRDAMLKSLADVKNPNQSRFSEMRTFPRIVDDVEAAKIAMSDERVTNNAVDRACREQPGECSKGGGDESVRQELEGKARRIAAEGMRDTSLTLKALESLANGLARLPGPKQVVVFSEGFYTDETADWLKQIVGIAGKNGVHFSTFDARGIAKDLRSQNFLNAAPVTSSGDLTSIDTDANADVLTSLALDTDGDRVSNSNNFREPLDKLARETSTYYVLGYRPSRAFDDSYRRLEVKVLRPDVIVRERRGYVAVHVATTPGPTPANASSPSAGVTPAPTPSSSRAGDADALGAASAATAAPPLVVAAGRSGIGAQPTGDEPAARSRPDSINLVTALADAKKSTGTAPNDAAAKRARDGWTLYAKGKVEQARDELAAAADASPKTAWIQYALGQAEFTLQHFPAASAAFEKVRRDLPDYEPVYFDLADSYLQLGQRGDALAVLREAERRWPNDSETHNAAGCVLIRRLAYDDAASAFGRAIAAAPADGLAYFNLARTYHLIFFRVVRSSSANATALSMIAERNRQRTIDEYKKYLAIGGPFEQEAREALALLGWK